MCDARANVNMRIHTPAERERELANCRCLKLSPRWMGVYVKDVSCVDIAGQCKYRPLVMGPDVTLYNELFWRSGPICF